MLLIDGYLINVLCTAHAVKLSGEELLCYRLGREKIPSAFASFVVAINPPRAHKRKKGNDVRCSRENSPEQ